MLRLAPSATVAGRSPARPPDPSRPGRAGHRSPARAAWLGHRRLSIMDPAGGAQPFVADGLAWVSNAEIFNHTELRARFGGDVLGIGLRGHRSDVACAWRRRTRRTGRPVRLGLRRGGERTLDRGSRSCRRVPALRRLARGRHLLVRIRDEGTRRRLLARRIVPPGHAWCSDERGDAPGQVVHARAGSSETPRAAADLPRLREVLIEAVRKRMMSDVPWGVLLSGGVDSSLVASIATRLCRERGAPPPQSFAIGLEGGPDLAAARRVADFLGTTHHELTFTIAEAMDAIPAAVSHLESYQQVRTAVPTMILARKVREAGVKMVLSGEGADELLGGYLYFHSAPSAVRVSRRDRAQDDAAAPLRRHAREQGADGPRRRTALSISRPRLHGRRDGHRSRGSHDQPRSARTPRDREGDPAAGVRRSVRRRGCRPTCCGGRRNSSRTASAIVGRCRARRGGARGRPRRISDARRRVFPRTRRSTPRCCGCGGCSMRRS